MKDIPNCTWLDTWTKLTMEYEYNVTLYRLLNSLSQPSCFLEHLFFSLDLLFNTTRHSRPELSSSTAVLVKKLTMRELESFCLFL